MDNFGAPKLQHRGLKLHASIASSLPATSAHISDSENRKPETPNQIPRALRPKRGGDPQSGLKSQAPEDPLLIPNKPGFFSAPFRSVPRTLGLWALPWGRWHRIGALDLRLTRAWPGTFIVKVFFFFFLFFLVSHCLFLAAVPWPLRVFKSGFGVHMHWKVTNHIQGVQISHKAKRSPKLLARSLTAGT